MRNAVYGIALAVTPLVFAELLPIQTFTTAEGLTHNHINRIRQDSHGFLWFATDGGLSRFNGQTFIGYTVADGLPHPWVNDLLEAGDGTWWLATDGGVVLFDPAGVSEREREAKAGSPMFRVFAPSGPPEARRINALAKDKDGSLLCATYDGLYRVRRLAGRIGFSKIELGLPAAAYEGQLVNNIVASARGGWWLATRNGLYRLFEDGQVASWRATETSEDFVETVYEDRSGRVWAGTRIGGFCQILQPSAPGKLTAARCYSTADGLPSNDVRALLQTSDGTFWVGTRGGLSEFYPDRITSPFHNYSGSSGLNDQYILKLAEDFDGNLWIGAEFTGVMKMPREIFLTFREQDGFRLSRSDFIFETRAGELVVVPAPQDHAFVQVFDGRGFQSIALNTPGARLISSQRGGVLQDHTGQWWVGTSSGLFRSAASQSLPLRQSGSVRTQVVAFGEEIVPTLFEDSAGDMWIVRSIAHLDGTFDTYVTRWERKTETFRTFEDASPFLKSSANVFQEDASGTLWVGLWRGGLLRRRQGVFEPVRAPEVTFRGSVEAIHVARSGQLWVATSQGLVRIENPDSDHPRFKVYTQDEGLSGNFVHCVTEDEWGRIYVGTDNGVDRLNPETNSIWHFNSSDGLDKGSILLADRDRHGALWFVAAAGVSRLIPLPDPVASTRETLISAVRIMGVPYRIPATGEADPHGLKVGPSSNQIEIDFEAPGFQPGGPLQYQYKLEGADAKWSAASRQQTVRYANLAPGVYRFLVRAVNSGGGATFQPASLSFQVLAPFWRRWWFVTMALTGVLASAYTVHHYRVGRLLALERVRTRIASDLHDDIGSSLSQIAILSEVAHRRANGRLPELDQHLAGIGSISREVLESMSDIVWAIDPERDKLRDLAYRMRRFATDVLTSRGIRLRFEAGGDEDLPLDPDLRRQLLLVLKEAVHNIVRHSGCTEAVILLRSERGVLRLRVWDNGNGLNVETAAHGQGLRSMKRRASHVGGEVGFSSEPGQGTTIEFSVPLPRRKLW
jgi:signal transduction histidine kinase/ligand-binding sensor domain-containing protein